MLILLMHQGIHMCRSPSWDFFTEQCLSKSPKTEQLLADYYDHNLADIAFITNGDAGDGKPSLILRSLLESNKIKRNKIHECICYQTFEKHKNGTLPILLLAIFQTRASLQDSVKIGSAFCIYGISITLCTNGEFTII